MYRLKKKRPGNGGEHGVALLMVLLFIALLGSVVADFQYNSRVDLQLAYNARDEVQAEYNALTALKVRSMLLKHSRKLQSTVDGLMRALSGGTDAGPMKMPIAQVLEMLPVECGMLGAIVGRADDPFGFDEESKSGEGGDDEDAVFVGDCMATSSSEHSKISINMLANRTNRASKQITNLLMGLLSDRKLESHFTEDDRNGTHADTPEDLVGAITDWIDGNDDQAVSSVADEDRPYAFLKSNYRVKNAPFDSVAELQLVHGIDDDLYRLLQDHVTIYNDGTQIELGTASKVTILMGLAASMRDGTTLEQMQTALGMFWFQLESLKQIGGGAFAPLNVAALRGLVQQSGLDAFIETRKLAQVFTDKAGTTWFTIEAQGRVGNASRRIRAVFQANEGQFYYVRIE